MGAINGRLRRNRRNRLAAELQCTWTPRRLFTFGTSVGGAHWFTDPNLLYRRRNRLTYTRDFGNAAWVKSGATATATRITATAGGTFHYAYQSQAIGTTGDPQTYTAEAKYVNSQWVFLNFPNDSSLTFFDLQNGVFGSIGGQVTSYSAELLSDGYYRLILKAPVAASNPRAGIGLAVSSSSGSFSAAGTEAVDVRNFQNELGSSPTEYQDVPTTWAQAYLDAVGAENIFAWVDNAGTTPVTAAGDTIGLSLDRAYGGARGSELSSANYVTSSTFDNVTTVVSASAFTQTAGTTNTRSHLNITTVVGTTYEVQCNLDSISSGTLRMLARSASNGTGTEVASSASASSGPLRLVFTATTTAQSVQWITSTTAQSSSISRITIRSVPGTHLIQATGTARPTLSARVNALLNTEDFSSASWTKVGGVSATATKIFASGTGTRTFIEANQQVGKATTSVQYVASAEFKESELRYAGLSLQSNGATSGVFTQTDARDGSVINQGTFGTGFTLVSVVRTVLSDGYVRVAATVTSNSDNPINLAVQGSKNTSFTTTSYTAGDGLFVRNADLRTADDASKNIPAYQRVGATAADHDTDGFPHGQYPDGTDDNQTTTTGGGGTTGFFYCGAITVSGGAGTARTIWSDTGTNTGYRVRINSSNKLELAAGNGSAYTTVESNETITAPGTYILSAWDDGGVLAVQVNNFAAATTTRPSVSAGTSTATMYKDNGAASSYLNGRDYGSVYRQSYIGESQHARLKRWLADRARITL